MRRRGWGVLVGAAVLVAGLSACRGGGNDPAVQGATVPTATWQLGPWSGQLSQLQTVGTIEDFEVRQIQAVVVSG